MLQSGILMCYRIKDFEIGKVISVSNTCSMQLLQNFQLTNANSLGGCSSWGWSGGAMVLGKLPVPGRPTNLDYSRARAYCACSRCGWGLFGHFFSRLSFLFSFSLSLGDGPI